MSKKNKIPFLLIICAVFAGMLISCENDSANGNIQDKQQIKSDSIIAIDSANLTILNKENQLFISEEDAKLKVEYKLDTAKSMVSWYCVTHHGHIKAKKGEITAIKDEIAEGNMEIIMNRFSIDDIDYYLMRETLANTLKSSDFFDVNKYPLAKFQLTHLKKTSENFYSAAGNLMIKDIVHKVLFKCTITPLENSIMLISDKFSIDRTKWGLTLYSKNYPQTDDSFLFTDLIDFQVYLIFVREHE
jgi:polyisoprenoid-binding protein YceI